MPVAHSAFNTAFRLGLFSFLIIGLVSVMFHLTRETIAENEYQALLSSLKAVIPAAKFDNDVVQDTLSLPPYSIYRARYQGQPAAALMISTAQGYNGAIIILTAYSIQEKIIGVRILSHQETPGLGDKIELRKSDWILGFKGLSLADVMANHWGVKRDGGDIDQFTGATITPRAVVSNIKQSAQFFLAHQREIFQ